MSKKLLILLVSILMLCGCNKFSGTWCRSTEVFGVIIVTTSDITDSELSNIESIIKASGTYKTYDVLDDIKKANTSITIYFKESSLADDLVTSLDGVDGIEKTEKKSFIVTSEKLEVKKKNQYTYSTNLDNEDSNVTSGTWVLNDDGTLTIDGPLTFYYKDKFVCSDKDCTNILTKKSKTNKCE